MARTPTHTVRVDDDFKARLEAEAKRRGIGWTTTLVMLAREALGRLEANNVG